jgi:hypothetical protein
MAMVDSSLGDTICVLDSLDSKEFERMKQTNYRILGASMVIYCAERHMSLPKVSYVLFSPVMMGTNICCTGISNRMELYTKVIMMGGQYSRHFTNEVTHLIAESTHSEKYQAALKLKIPIVHPKWIEACWSKCQQELFVSTEIVDSYRLAVLIDCIVCVTGIDETARVKIAHLTKLHGGVYLQDLTKQCTHLLAEVPQGRKYDYAIKWNIKVVKPQWFFDCLKYGGMIDESDYLISPEEKDTKPMDLSSDIDDPPMPVRSSENNNSTFYLEGLKIILSDYFEIEKSNMLKKIILHGGGVRVTTPFHSLGSQVDLLVVSNKKLDDKDQILLKKMENKPAVVSAKWLKDCYRQCTRLPIDNYRVVVSIDEENLIEKEKYKQQQQPFEMKEMTETNGRTTVSQELIHKRKATQENPSILSADFLNLFDQKTLLNNPKTTLTNSPSFPTMDMRNIEDISTVMNEKANSSTMGHLFEGLTFIIAGFSHENTSIIIQAIHAQSGSIVDRGYLSEKASFNRLYLLAPFVAEPPITRQPMMIVTEFWLERCIEDNKLYDANDDYILFHPCGLRQSLLSSGKYCDYDVMKLAFTIMR